MFGSHLNKNKTSEQASCSGSEGDGGGRRKGPTWKLRKWTRGEGYRTVVAGRSAASDHQEGGGEGEEEDAPAGSSTVKDKTADSTAKENNEVRAYAYTCTDRVILFIREETPLPLHNIKDSACPAELPRWLGL